MFFLDRCCVLLQNFHLKREPTLEKLFVFWGYGQLEEEYFSSLSQLFESFLRDKGGASVEDKNEHNSFSMLKWLLLWFVTLFFTMLLTYLGTHYRIRLFILSTERTILPLVFPVGFTISSYFFKKAFLLSQKRFAVVWCLQKAASIILYLFSFFFLMFYCLDIFFD